jgi:rod shape-determining protein MreD
MIMRPGQQLLLPANPVFIWGTLLMALLLNMAANMGGPGSAAWMPDLLALVLVFMDVHQAALLGQHALSYTALSFFAITIHRRLLWFSVPSQAMQVLPLFAAAHAIALAVRLIGGGLFPGWALLLAPLLEALLWPVASILLLAPQRRAPNPDANRPL